MKQEDIEIREIGIPSESTMLYHAGVRPGDEQELLDKGFVLEGITSKGTKAQFKYTRTWCCGYCSYRGDETDMEGPDEVLQAQRANPMRCIDAEACQKRIDDHNRAKVQSRTE